MSKNYILIFFFSEKMLKGYGPESYELFCFCLLLSIVHHVVEIPISVIMLPVWSNTVTKLYRIIISVCQI